jgi:hypothetical protein
MCKKYTKYYNLIILSSKKKVNVKLTLSKYYVYLRPNFYTNLKTKK